MNLLVVSESFGVDSGIGGQRIGSFVKNLSRRGVSTFVLAGARHPSPIEVALEEVFPDVGIGAGPDARAGIERSRVATLPSRIDPPRLGSRLQQRFPVRSSIDARSLMASGARKLASAYAFYTFGELRGWVQRAIEYGEQVARCQRVDAVVATFGSEYWNFEVAHVLGHRLRVPVVLDVRDEWDRFFGGNGRRSIVYPLMHRYFSACTLGVCATKSVAVRLNQFWPNTPTAVIHNGFDMNEEAPALGRAPDSNGPLVLGHIGSFWHNEQWPKFADAVAQLATAREVKVVYRGRNPQDFRDVVARRRYPAGVTFDIAEMVPRAASLELVQQAHVLIAAVPVDSQGAVPAKMFDAIAMSKPLLVLGDRAPAYLVEYLSDCPSPWLVVDSVTSAATIAEFFEEAPARRVHAHERRLKYSARSRADELHGVLGDLLTRNARAPRRPWPR